jgi:glycosyltransferase involved in cell wall biosynthesis
MKKVLFVWQAGYPWEIRVEKFARHLAGRGTEVTILARARPGQTPEEELESGIRVVRVGLGRPGAASLPVPWNPLWDRAIRQQVKVLKPDLVIARDILLADSCGAAAARAGIPMVIDMAEHYPASMRALEKYQRNPLMRLLVFQARLPDRVERSSVTRADGVITVCDEQNRRLNRTYGYPWEKMAVVNNTPELEMFARVRLGPNEPASVFAYHGTMTAQRGLDHLLRALADVRTRHPEIRLVLAGHGDSLPGLQRLADELRLGEAVRFTGRYPFEALPDLYSETDIGMITYPANEANQHTIGNKLFDYMACGKPVIVSPTDPMRRVVEETGVGIVLGGSGPEQIAEGMERMLGTDTRAFSQRGLAACRAKYNWDHDAEVLSGFLRRYSS